MKLLFHGLVSVTFMAGMSAGQMVEYSTASADMEYNFWCPQSQHCLIKPLVYTTVPDTSADEDADHYVIDSRYVRPFGKIDPPKAWEAYRFVLENNDLTVPISGCKNGNCVAMCDPGCSCTATPLAGGEAQSCTVTQQLPDVRIPTDSELVIYDVGFIRDPDYVRFYCPDFLTVCDVPEEYSFRNQALAPNRDEYFFSWEGADCIFLTGQAEANPCPIVCDPRCTCDAYFDDVRRDCVTMEHTLAPVGAPGGGGSDNGNGGGSGNGDSSDNGGGGGSSASRTLFGTTFVSSTILGGVVSLMW